MDKGQRSQIQQISLTLKVKVNLTVSLKGLHCDFGVFAWQVQYRK